MKYLFSSILVYLFFISNSYAQITKTNEPLWIKTINYSKTEIDNTEVSSGTHLLLFDSQINVPKQTLFNRIITKITDNVGIQEASTINISYDPTYQKLKFHKINIVRDNQVIEKLDISNFQLIRRELNAENYLYDGSLSAVMNISDVRTGDIIDYSYSLIGFNPIHKNIFSSNFYLNDIESVGKINIDIISKNKLNYKSFNSKIEPEVTIKNNLHYYNWQASQTDRLEYELNTPAWKLIYETVFVSEFNSWKEVVNWGLDVYNINQPLNSELLAKINEIDTKYLSKGDKIKATLNFVQNEIRYLGLESGISSYKPFSPNQVFDQRFGDCKDKSLLMTTMLNTIGIEAYPMLVNTYLKQSIKDLLPSPNLFDHCVVKVMDENSKFYYDPTIANQGGDYDSTYFPDYRFGLVLKKGISEFDDITSRSENKVKSYEEYSIDSIGKGASLKVVTSYHESEADNMRNYYKNNSINAIKKEYENFYSNYYFNITASKDPHYEDDSYHNVFKVFEEYQIDSIWKPMPEKENHIAISFLPSSLLNALYLPTKSDRKTELAINYPILREHQTKIKLPMHWGIEEEKIFINSPSFYYEWKVDYDAIRHVVDLHYYLKTQKDHVDVNGFKHYLTDVNKFELTTGYSLFVPKNYSTLNNNSNSINFLNVIATIMKFLILLGVLAVIVLFIFWIANKKKRNDAR